MTPATRLSMALAFMTLSLLLAAAAIGFVPDRGRDVAESRLRLSERLTLQLSLATRDEHPVGLPRLLQSMLAEHSDMRSVGLRTMQGELSFASPGHVEAWQEDATPATRIALPIYHDDEAVGTVEFCYQPIDSGGFMGSGTRLVLFITLLGFLAYRFYLRRVLKHLDPSAVIPERVKAMLDTMAEGVLILDDHDRIVLANQAFTNASGMPLGKLLGRKATEIPIAVGSQDEATAPPAVPWTKAVASGGLTRGIRVRLQGKTRDDQQVFVVNSTPIVGGDGRRRGMLATFDDVTAIEEKNMRLERMVRELDGVRQKIQRQNEELQLLATRDPLTNCFNRRALFERLETEWSGAERYGYGFSCLMLDIDHFKSINDNHGHAVGDQVLERVAAILQSRSRPRDVVGRYGGEEFCILLPHTSLEQAFKVGENIRLAIAGEIFGGVTATISVGVSSLELGANAPQMLIDEADKALYAAKHGGRNHVVSWDQIPKDLSAATDADSSPSQTTVDASSAIPYPAVAGLMAALTHRDPGTAAHCRRVGDLCVLTARGLMSAADLFVLEAAGMLHDIGKIGVPDAVLLKPGKLTREEWEIMEKHDRIGIEIINAAFHCPELTNIVRNHHATFGGGARDPSLPTGLGIPLRARILTIADAYDAMISDRVYRKGMSQQEAFAELRHCAGTQFDPELVERFVATVEAHDRGSKPGPVGDATEVVLRLGLASERLVAALNERDLRTVAAMADHLRSVATKYERDQIARLAEEVVKATDTESELTKVLEATNQLLDLCQSAQAEVLSMPAEFEPSPAHDAAA